MAFQALIQTMTALNGVHDALSELAEQKKQVLIYNRVEQLTQIVSKENKLIKQIGELDQQRVEVIGQFLIEKGYKPNPKVTVSDLTKIIFNMDDKKALLELQKQLLGTIRKLREMNQLNQQLIEHSLSFIDYSLDLIVGPPEDDVFYHKPQQNAARGNKRLGIFDTRA
ncbi:flagellar protein FlgN [Paenibacillus agricola]|uniref:Flagellar protein FlgN n=1 Tax=Paenibacillus agricola TaxID=2716264 RepID=A0ABX0JHN2_9BACL|nr:flagellar protein FlgN [Paenibacillus agricola]NHN33864.1 flagellar protein FlgN [Paenibacillus agricola]